MTKLDHLKVENRMLEARLRTARDKEILLLTQLLELKKKLEELERKDESTIGTTTIEPD